MSTGYTLFTDRKPNEPDTDARVIPVLKNANPRPGETPAEDPGQMVGVVAIPSRRETGRSQSGSRN